MEEVFKPPTLKPQITLRALLSRRSRIRRRDSRLLADHLVADAVGDGLLGVEEAIALRIVADLLDALPGALGHDGDEGFLGFENFLGLDFDVRRLPVHAAE